jgi:hypothetical protein
VVTALQVKAAMPLLRADVMQFRPQAPNVEYADIVGAWDWAGRAREMKERRIRVARDFIVVGGLRVVRAVE